MKKRFQDQKRESDANLLESSYSSQKKFDPWEAMNTEKRFNNDIVYFTDKLKETDQELVRIDKTKLIYIESYTNFLTRFGQLSREVSQLVSGSNTSYKSFSDISFAIDQHINMLQIEQHSDDTKSSLVLAHTPFIGAPLSSELTNESLSLISNRMKSRTKDINKLEQYQKDLESLKHKTAFLLYDNIITDIDKIACILRETASLASDIDQVSNEADRYYNDNRDKQIIKDITHLNSDISQKKEIIENMENELYYIKENISQYISAEDYKKEDIGHFREG